MVAQLAVPHPRYRSVVVEDKSHFLLHVAVVALEAFAARLAAAD